jgi:proprotein convertase subtilisin/kexin type 5
MEILFLYNYKCLLSCTTGYWKNSSIQNDHHCTLCHPFCFKCTGPSNMDCQSCKNVASVDPITGASITNIYYKDLESTTCAATCPIKQFISSLVMNECVPCHNSCEMCQGSKLNCSKCTFDYYLHQEAFSCVTQCPSGYFNDDRLTANNYLCTICTAGCRTCNGLGLEKCQSCTNVTLANGTIERYFKDQKYDKCSKVCAVG